MRVLQTPVPVRRVTPVIRTPVTPILAVPLAPPRLQARVAAVVARLTAINLLADKLKSTLHPND